MRLWTSEEKFSRATLNAEKKSELLKTLSDTQWKVKQLLEKLNEWPLEKQEISLNNWHGWWYNSSHEPKHTPYRAGVIRKIKNEIIAGYTNVREILKQSRCINDSEDLELMHQCLVFNETFTTTLTSSQVKTFQSSIFNILKPILVEMEIVK
jgi:hypothetical protein